MPKPSGKASLAISLSFKENVSLQSLHSSQASLFFSEGRSRQRSSEYEQYKLIQTNLSEKREKELGYSVQGSLE